MMLIVTGANGFIGSALIWELNRAGFEDILCVDPVSLEERGELLKPLKYTQIFDKYEIFDYLKKHSPNINAVFHIGACSSTTETNEAFLKENNTDYSKLFFNYCTEKDIPFIYASSAATYGDGSLGFSDLTDSSNLAPLNLYGWSKLNFDIWALQQPNTPRRWYGLRYFNVYGPNEYHKKDMASVVYKAFHQIKKNGSLKLFKSHDVKYEDGKQLRDFVYIKDVTRWMLEFLNNTHAESGIYNMGFGKAQTWLDLATATFKHTGEPLNIDWIEIPENIREQYQYFTEAKMDKHKSQGLSDPEWSLEVGIKDYVSNYLLSESPYLNL